MRDEPTWTRYLASASAVMGDHQVMSAVTVFDNLKGAFLYTPDPLADLWDNGRFATISGVAGPRQVMKGDCEDFAFEAMRRTIDIGIPRGALRIAVCRLASGQGHAVLVLEGRLTTHIADCRMASLKPWGAPDFAGYSWLAASHPGQWDWRKI